MDVSTDYRARIATELFGETHRPLDSYFQLYDSLIARSDVHALQVEEPGPEDLTPITHEDILEAVRVLPRGP